MVLSIPNFCSNADGCQSFNQLVKLTNSFHLPSVCETIDDDIVGIHIRLTSFSMSTQSHGLAVYLCARLLAPRCQIGSHAERLFPPGLPGAVTSVLSIRVSWEVGKNKVRYKRETGIKCWMSKILMLDLKLKVITPPTSQSGTNTVAYSYKTDKIPQRHFI